MPLYCTYPQHLVHVGAPRPKSKSDTLALVRGKVAVVVVKKDSFRSRHFHRVVGPLVSCLCVYATRIPRHNITDSVSLVSHVTAKFPTELDRIPQYFLQLLLDLDVSSIRFVWIPPPPEVDPVRQDGVCIKVKVDGGVVTSFEETGRNLRDQVQVCP